MNQKTQNKIAPYQQTIIAQCTPRGSGAIALIRLSGVDAVCSVDQLCKLLGGKKLSEQKSHTIHFGYVVDEKGDKIDQVLFLLMRAPHTFTGQDVVEITCHNNQFLIEAIIDRAIACGVRLAGPGEFSQRAVQEGKIDLVQAEALHDLINAQTAESLKYSLAQLQGTFSSFLSEIEQAVIEMIVFCEASFEFLDEEGIEFSAELKIKIDELMVKIKGLLSSYSKQQYIKQGVKIVLAGATNVGKSSLFNCLINHKRSIVTEIAGTTRDSIEFGLYKKSGYITFVDTAGIRNAVDRIEQEGIRRSFDEVAKADIILLVIDDSLLSIQEQVIDYQNLLQKYASKIILVQNKIDRDSCVDVRNILSMSQDNSFVQVSAQENSNIDKLHYMIDEKIEALKGSGQIICLLNQRHYNLLSAFLKQLEEIACMLRQPIDYELVSYHLREALQLLSEVSGRSVSESVLEQVFKSFCVGK
ncbi:tRNA uridine-5-carboxymethylaminomethyl(34) synthesis GTPase MnmE [Candidatus Dependentiae bacterium]|nr:tRNA uridine-5-carboxymethylaminomethyl(34) synthesis GTPase MnmE [Candidatus Dependentiae bacterium]